MRTFSHHGVTLAALPQAVDRSLCIEYRVTQGRGEMSERSEERGAAFQVVWEADQGIEPVPPATQRGFFLSGDGSAFHTRPWKGDKMIKPTEGKKKKPKGKGQTPFDEVVAFEAAQRAAIYGEGTTDVVETVNGGVRFERHTGGAVQVSTVGEGGARFRTERGSRPSAPDVSTLSPAAQRLYRKRRADECEAIKALKGQARENGLQAFASTGGVSPKSAYPGKAEEGVRWETLRRMVALAREALK